MTQYTTLKEQHSKQLAALKKQYNLISTIRLFVAVAFLYSCYQQIKSGDDFFKIILATSAILFLYLVRKHQVISNKIEVEKALLEINENEISFLEGTAISFENGMEYNNSNHEYSYDLDIFGNKSLFQNLNRTATYIGKTTLTKLLLTILPNDEIIANQNAIKELNGKLSWRQKIYAFAKITKDSKSSYDNLIAWSKSKSEEVSTLIKVAAFLLPVLLIGSLSVFTATHETKFWSLFVLFFITNMALLASQLRKIKVEIVKSDKMHSIIKQYGLILLHIENENFESEKLKQLKSKLLYEGVSASARIQELSSLFNQMDSMQNLFGGVLFNGFILYHIHVLNALHKWKNNNATFVVEWLDVIGELEAMNSLANFSYNNPSFSFPQLNTNSVVSLTNVGHPLINTKKRIDNSIEFKDERFVILTGSNMSGKSTFLRTLGINMVLAGVGSPICASAANIHPMQVLVSMRLSDSLTDSESYFFAEVKRLKEIMDTLERKKCFVLLDEILRGTNSDDKRNGTIEVIKKMIAKNAIGAIATHDLEVCLTTNQYPNILANKCFEVEIVNNDLVFDYKLRDGICQNKSASFLMKKMGVI